MVSTAPMARISSSSLAAASARLGRQLRGDQAEVARLVAGARDLAVDALALLAA